METTKETTTPQKRWEKTILEAPRFPIFITRPIRTTISGLVYEDEGKGPPRGNRVSAPPTRRYKDPERSISGLGD